MANRTPRQSSTRIGYILEGITLMWNGMGVVVLAIAAISAKSVALAGFGLDSLVEIGASTVVLWELRDIEGNRRSRALRLIGWAFLLLALYLIVQSSYVLVTGFHSRHSVLGIAWTSVTAVVMFALASGKFRVGRSLKNQVLLTEGRVTFIDGVVAATVLLGLVLNAAIGWWWADPVAGLAIAGYSVREGIEAVGHSSHEACEH